MTENNNVLDFTEKDKVTKLGKFMRKYGIDELPQLPIYFQYYTEEERKKFYVLLGMLGPNTCLHYHRTIQQKNSLDVDYVNNYLILLL